MARPSWGLVVLLLALAVTSEVTAVADSAESARRTGFFLGGEPALAELGKHDLIAERFCDRDLEQEDAIPKLKENYRARHNHWWYKTPVQMLFGAIISITMVFFPFILKPADSNLTGNTNSLLYWVYKPLGITELVNVTDPLYSALGRRRSEDWCKRHPSECSVNGTATVVRYQIKPGSVSMCATVVTVTTFALAMCSIVAYKSMILDRADGMIMFRDDGGGVTIYIMANFIFQFMCVFVEERTNYYKSLQKTLIGWFGGDPDWIDEGEQAVRDRLREEIVGNSSDTAVDGLSGAAATAWQDASTGEANADIADEERRLKYDFEHKSRVLSWQFSFSGIFAKPISVFGSLITLVAMGRAAIFMQRSSSVLDPMYFKLTAVTLHLTILWVFTLVYFMWRYDLDGVSTLSDALYHAVITHTTVGFGDVGVINNRGRALCAAHAVTAFMLWNGGLEVFASGFANVHPKDIVHVRKLVDEGKVYTVEDAAVLGYRSMNGAAFQDERYIKSFTAGSRWDAEAIEKEKARQAQINGGTLAQGMAVAKEAVQGLAQGMSLEEKQEKEEKEEKRHLARILQAGHVSTADTAALLKHFGALMEGARKKPVPETRKGSHFKLAADHPVLSMLELESTTGMPDPFSFIAMANEDKNDNRQTKRWFMQLWAHGVAHVAIILVAVRLFVVYDKEAVGDFAWSSKEHSTGNALVVVLCMLLLSFGTNVVASMLTYRANHRIMGQWDAVRIFALMSSIFMGNIWLANLEDITISNHFGSPPIAATISAIQLTLMLVGRGNHMYYQTPGGDSMHAVTHGMATHWIVIYGFALVYYVYNADLGLLNFSDALYASIIIHSTVGYGDFNGMASPRAKLLMATHALLAYLLFGVGIMTLPDDFTTVLVRDSMAAEALTSKGELFYFDDMAKHQLTSGVDYEPIPVPQLDENLIEPADFTVSIKAPQTEMDAYHKHQDDGKSWGKYLRKLTNLFSKRAKPIEGREVAEKYGDDTQDEMGVAKNTMF